MLKEAIETPEENPPSDIETDFIKHAIEKSKALTIFLVNGIKLEGSIIAMGKDSFLLKRDENIQLVYKHSISTILPLDSTNFIP
tara:strand:+ start:2374 stop:2625 length:252 start_codon:yes stop_codon:yes gene_type:complete